MSDALDPKLTLVIAFGNEAMQTGYDAAQALRKMADVIEERFGYGYIDNGFDRSVVDLNGNRVGKCRYIDPTGCFGDDDSEE